MRKDEARKFKDEEIGQGTIFRIEDHDKDEEGERMEEDHDRDGGKENERFSSQETGNTEGQMEMRQGKERKGMRVKTSKGDEKYKKIGKGKE